MRAHGRLGQGGIRRCMVTETLREGTGDPMGRE